SGGMKGAHGLASCTSEEDRHWHVDKSADSKRVPAIVRCGSSEFVGRAVCGRPNRPSPFSKKTSPQGQNERTLAPLAAPRCSNRRVRQPPAAVATRGRVRWVRLILLICWRWMSGCRI